LNKSYFWFLEPFTLEQLEEQKQFLTQLLEAAEKTCKLTKSARNSNNNNADSSSSLNHTSNKEVCSKMNDDWAATSKHRRRTLRKQIARIEDHMAAMFSSKGRGAGGREEIVVRKCRWCEKCLVSKWQITPQTQQKAKGLANKVCDGRCWGFWKAPVSGSYREGDGDEIV
jgi:5'-3' exonuclease